MIVQVTVNSKISARVDHRYKCVDINAGDNRTYIVLLYNTTEATLQRDINTEIVKYELAYLQSLTRYSITASNVTAIKDYCSKLWAVSVIDLKVIDTNPNSEIIKRLDILIEMLEFSPGGAIEAQSKEHWDQNVKTEFDTSEPQKVTDHE